MSESITIIPFSPNSTLFEKSEELQKLNLRVTSAENDFSDSNPHSLKQNKPVKSLKFHKNEPYAICCRLESQLEHLELKKESIIEEMKNLSNEALSAKEELKRVQAVPLAVGHFGEMIDEDHAIVHSNSGQSYFAKVMSTLPRELLRPNTSIALHRHSNSAIKILEPHLDASVSATAMTKKPEVTFKDIGGLDSQKRELREAVELPLTHAELFRSVGVDPPRGVLLYGPPGTGKTMIAKAVANASDAAFINVVASEFVQKYIGEGARMVRNVFQLAKESAQRKKGKGAIIFIDEIDAIGMARHDSSVSSDREVQRILLELLNQMDGFEQNTSVKVIMATNRPDTLDPALMRPGRLDRKIEFPMPDRRQRRLVYAAATAEMSLDENLDLEVFVRRPEKISSADIAGICAEAGLCAIRANRYLVGEKDFEKAYESVVKRTDRSHDFYS